MEVHPSKMKPAKAKKRTVEWRFRVIV